MEILIDKINVTIKKPYPKNTHPGDDIIIPRPEISSLILGMLINNPFIIRKMILSHTWEDEDLNWSVIKVDILHTIDLSLGTVERDEEGCMQYYSDSIRAMSHLISLIVQAITDCTLTYQQFDLYKNPIIKLQLERRIKILNEIITKFY